MPSGAYAACAVGFYAWLAGANGRVLFTTAAGAVAGAVTGNATAGRDSAPGHLPQMLEMLELSYHNSLHG